MITLIIIAHNLAHIAEAASIATSSGAKVTHVPDITSALDHIKSGKSVDLIMVDISYDIRELNNRLKAEKLYAPIIAFGTHTQKELAVAAIKAGAKDYITLPPDEELIAAVFEDICQHKNDLCIIGQDKAFLDVLERAKKIASSDLSVLITGESGTGKEVVAKLLHVHHPKRSKFNRVTVNCAAIPGTLLESEMFGYEKGAFTGAHSRRIGKFEEANKGSILLDEISEMDHVLQAKLLRVIQEREITRIGGNQSINIDTRIIATSNRNLLDSVHNNTFRADLFYRLNVINIRMPALRERISDIKDLALHFIQKYAESNLAHIKELTNCAIEKLSNHIWPGNIRELENTIYRAMLLESNDSISANSIELISNDTPNQDISESLMRSALKECYGDYRKAANVLDVSLKRIKKRIMQASGG